MDLFDYLLNKADDIKNELQLISKPSDTLVETVEAKQIDTEHLINTLGITYKDLILLTEGRIKITETIAEKLEGLLGVDKQFWINRQNNYDNKLAGILFPDLPDELINDLKDAQLTLSPQQIIKLQRDAFLKGLYWSNPEQENIFS